MISYLDARTRAFHHLQAAHQILTTSYPVLKEEKLLLVALNHLFLSFQDGLQILITAKHDVASPSIPTMRKYVRKHSLSPLSLIAFQQIQELVRLHKQSPVEFSKNDNFVICSTNYELSVLTQEKLQEFLLILEQFLNSIDRIVLSEHL
ncbi:MAG: hypothetical protein QW331_03355 [Candidatus Woesearchaeota archaeon]